MDKNFEIEKMIIKYTNFIKENDEQINSCEKMIDYYKKKIEEYQKKDIEFRVFLSNQFDAIIPKEELKETKTQYSYKTPSCKFTKKKEKFDIELSDRQDFSQVPERFEKLEKKIDWANYKKILAIDNEKIVNTQTGEIIENCKVKKIEESDWRFEINV